jgi:hypothetical protein
MTTVHERALRAGKTALVNVIGDRTIGHPSLGGNLLGARYSSQIKAHHFRTKLSLMGASGQAKPLLRRLQEERADLPAISRAPLSV